MKILVIEDDNSLRELMHKALTDDNHIVETAANAKTAMMKAEVYDYDCILLDIMLPDGNGLDVLRQLKATRKEAGVIIVSAKDSIDDKVAGLDLGADDYLTKPFHIAELSARVKSVFRRKQQHGEHFIELGNVRIMPETRQILIKGQPVELLKKEFADPLLLSDDEVAEVLNTADKLSEWVEAVKKYAQEKAVVDGKVWPGYKLVHANTMRKWVDETVAATAIKDCFPEISDDQIDNMKLKGITEVQKLVGKKNFDAMLGEVVVKPEGAPTLVPVTDKRPAIGLEDAVNDFTNK